jgi:uncharacterized membrane protein
MKKHLLVYLFAIIAISVNGQNAVPNGNFENWSAGTYNLPTGYPVSSDPSTLFRYMTSYNVLKTTDAFHGTYAVQLNTVVSSNSDTVFAYLVPIQVNDAPTKWHGGIAYDQIPTGIRGYYKYNIASKDSGTIIVAFSKSGNNIGTYFYTVGGLHSAYTLFDFKFSPALSVTPDSVIFGAISCKFTAATQQPVATALGSLTIDSVSFTGVANQPSAFNGDFENWFSHTYYLPQFWSYNGDDQGSGLFRSTDYFGGSYALELKTFLGNSNNKPSAQSAQVLAGNYDNSCHCQKGGFPFTNATDTLVFHYKYAPSGNDSAQVNFSLIKNGGYIWGTNAYLHAASSYQYKEIVINSLTAPDSAMIQIQSSAWHDTALSFVGSDLLIDSMYFKSQIPNTGIHKLPVKDNISIYPNPGNGRLKIQDFGFNAEKLVIFNIQGKEVYTSLNLKPMSINEIDLSKIEKGIYVIKLYHGDNIHIEKIIIQ